MPRLTTLVSLLLAAIPCGSLFAANTQPTIQSLNKMPLAFTKNMGQWDDRVLFRANSGGATMWFTKEGVTYQFTRRIDTRSGAVSAPGVGQNRFGFDASDPRTDTRDSIEQLALTAKFLGANPNPKVIAEGQMEYKCNYFLGNDPTKWHTDVPNYQAITLKDIYPGIDLKYSSDGNGQAAYEFIAAPGADIAQIKVTYEGVEETSLDSDGKLILKTKWGDMIAAIKSPADSPRPLGEGSGVRAVLFGTAGFSQSSEKTIGFETDRSTRLTTGGQSLAQGKSGTLTLSYSTYLGGGDWDYGKGIAVDSGGHVYVTGYTHSSNFPTLNPYQTDQGVWDVDVFVTKLSNSGNSLIYSTYLGGRSDDRGYDIAVDGGNAYVTGTTNSNNFPTLNPYQGTYQRGYSDVFVTKLSNSGNSLIYSTYLGGGSGYDEGYGIAVDGSGNAYVTGATESSNFPTQNPFQDTYGGGTYPYGDAFATKLSSSGNSLIYSTYLGGGDSDWGNGIAVDGSGNAYVTGDTWSYDFPTLNPYQTYIGGGFHGSNVFVTKLSSSGNALVYSTYLGGGGDDDGYDIAVDGSGYAYVTGVTDSPNFPTLNPYQATNQGYVNAFVTKLSGAGNSLIYSSYLGGGGYDWGGGIAVDGSGNAYVTGRTYSSNFPTLNPYQTYQGPSGYLDAFVTKLSSSGNTLIYSTYLGGRDYDEGTGIVVDGSGNVYVTGETQSGDFPTLNPYQPNQGGFYWDVFVTKLSWVPDYLCGDVNTDEQIDLLDAVFLINYIFVGGPAPQSLALADVNCSGSINIADVVLLINYIFRAGPAPCTECE